MSYKIETRFNAPAYTPGRPRKPTEVVIHHYGSDDATYNSSMAWLTRPGAVTSAHYVVEAGLVACIVDPDDTAYHAGSWPVNQRAIGIENHPIWTAARERTLIELCADLEEEYGGLRYSVHQNHFNTSCPGRWVARMPHIINGINAELARRKAGKAKPQPVQHTTDPAPAKSGPRWVVERGDTLGKIAAYYGIPRDVARIAKHNRISDPNQIKVGQTIWIPAPLVWVVEPGDTWAKIDAYYGYAPGAVQSRNPGKQMKPGTVLNIWG